MFGCSVPEQVRPRLSQYRDEVDVVGMAHNASVVLDRIIPSPFVLSLGSNMVMHDIYELPVFSRLVRVAMRKSVWERKQTIGKKYGDGWGEISIVLPIMIFGARTGHASLCRRHTPFHSDSNHVRQERASDASSCILQELYL